MGLEEKRWVKEQQEKTTPHYLAKFKEYAGTDIALDVDWNGFSANLEESKWIHQYGLDRLASVLHQIGGDDIGKTALKEGLKKIVIRPADSSKTRISLKNGVLEWDAYFGEKSEGYITEDALKQTVEKVL